MSQASKVVPIFNDSPIQNIPLDKLPSQADFLHLLWHHVDGNFSGFQGENQKKIDPNNYIILLNFPQEFSLFAAQW